MARKNPKRRHDRAYQAIMNHLKQTKPEDRDDFYARAWAFVALAARSTDILGESEDEDENQTQLPPRQSDSGAHGGSAEPPRPPASSPGASKVRPVSRRPPGQVPQRAP